VFDSADELVTAIKAFQLIASKAKLASQFIIPEMEHENPGKPIAASAIQSCEAIWSDDKSALLFATANPPTVGTYSSIGVLFLLVHQRDGCRMPTFCDLRQSERTQESPPNSPPLRAAGVSLAAKASILSSQSKSLKAAAGTRMTRVPPTSSPAQSLSVSIWNSRDAFIIFS
jgi:hypothetical protein